MFHPQLTTFCPPLRPPTHYKTTSNHPISFIANHSRNHFLLFTIFPSKALTTFLSHCPKMLGKKLGSMKKLAKKIKSVNNTDPEPSHCECLLKCNEEGSSPTSTSTPVGTFAMYVGPDRQRFVVPTSYLSHPLFKMLLDKAHNEFGFDQRNGLEVPCSVAAFQEVISAVECCNGKFDFGDKVEEFI